MLRAALLIDLDRFGDVNAALGRDAGDALLGELAARLRAAVRPEDTVEHLCGGSYLVLRDGVAGPWEARADARRVAAAWAEPFHLAGDDVFVTCSVGIAVGAPTASCCARPTRRCTTPRSAGRGGVELYDDVLRAGALKRLRLERDFRRALARARSTSRSSRSSTCTTGARARSRRSRAGRIPSAARCPRRSSSRSPSAAA